MVFSSGKKTYLERRLKELERESKRVQGDIKTISKAVRKPEQLAVQSRLQPARNNIPPETPAPDRGPEPSEESAGGAANKLGGHQDLFSWNPRLTSAHQNIASGPSPAGVSRREVAQVVSKKPAVTGDERFASYFSSGGFMGARPVKQDKNVQRNKAIFMVILLIVVGLWVLSLLF